MKATEILKHEHRLVLAVMDAAEREGAEIRESGTVDAEKVRKMVDFFRGFVDQCHHMKEEQRLFPMLEERGLPRERGPVGVMLAEHDEGRAHAAAIEDCLEKADSGTPESAMALADTLHVYADQLRAHISKEDNILFPMADGRLTDADQEELVAAFERIEAEEVGAGVHERYHELVHELIA